MTASGVGVLDARFLRSVFGFVKVFVMLLCPSGPVLLTFLW